MTIRAVRPLAVVALLVLGLAPMAWAAGKATASTTNAPPVPVAMAPAAMPVQLIVEPDQGRAAVLAGIGNAQQTITLTIYEINDLQINAALIAAVKRGVKVRILYNYYSFYHEGRASVVAPMMATFTQAGIACQEAPERFAITHQKTFVFDGRTAIIMTFNLTTSYFGGTRDFGVITSEPALVAEIVKVFEADWTNAPVTPTEPALVWSPVNSRVKITAVITNAQRTLELYNEEASDKQCMAALAAAAQRGVKVRFITAVLGTSTNDGNAAGRAQLNAAGAQAIPASFYYIHAKMVLADYATPQALVYLGSENISEFSLDRNRELGILLNQTNVLDTLHAVFEQDWARANEIAAAAKSKPVPAQAQ